MCAAAKNRDKFTKTLI